MKYVLSIALTFCLSALVSTVHGMDETMSSSYKSDAVTVTLSDGYKSGDNSLSVQVVFGDHQQSINMDRMPSVFAEDAVLEIVDETHPNGKVVHNLNDFSSNHFMKKPDDNSDEWAIFVENRGKIMNGLFTTDKGTKMFQINDAKLEEKDIAEPTSLDGEGRNLRSNPTGYVVRQVTMRDFLSLFGDNKHSDHSRTLLENDGDDDNSNSTSFGNLGCDSKSETIPYAKRSGNKGARDGEKNKKEQIDDPFVVDPSKLQVSSVTSGKPTPFFPGCFDTDTVTRQFEIGLAIDAGFYKKAGGDLNSVTSEVESMVANTRLLYLQQLNIMLKVGKMTIGTASSPFPLKMSPDANTCVKDTSYVLDQFGKWNGATNDNTSAEKGVWHLLTNCWPAPGVVGIANMASLCDARRNVGITSRISTTQTWLIFAHELGHSFGAQHTFGVGGIMDYNNPAYNGVVQFHPDNKPEMCKELAYRATTCDYFKTLSSGTACGNGVLEKGEDCECIANGSKSCGSCKSCKLAKSSIKCSTKEFVVRSRTSDMNKDYISAIASNLSDQACCSSAGVMYEPTRNCNGGKDVCIQGKCTALCTKYKLGTCKMINNGCKQPCIYQGDSKCYPDVRTQTAGVYVGWVPNGVSCNNGRGTCSNGECV